MNLGCDCQHSHGLGSASVPLLSGDAGVQQTVALMYRLVDEGVKDPRVNRYAIDIVRNSGIPQHDPMSAARAIFAAVEHAFFFVNDPVGPHGAKETLRPPFETIQLGAGDCDDFTVLMLSLMGTIGIEGRIRTVASDETAPQEFSHVYPEVYLEGSWIPADAARPNAAFGKAPARVFRSKVWPAPMNAVSDALTSALNGYAVMGDDSSTAQDISAVTTGAANIILSTEANPNNIYGVVNTTSLPAGYPSSVINPFGATSISPTMLLLLGLGAALLIARR